jgi:hypothetical protein
MCPARGQRDDDRSGSEASSRRFSAGSSNPFGERHNSVSVNTGVRSAVHLVTRSGQYADGWRVLGYRGHAISTADSRYIPLDITSTRLTFTESMWTQLQLDCSIPGPCFPGLN